MPIVTFWSNNEKAIGQTVSAALTATVMAIECNYKILLISADYNNSKMENCFGAQETNKAIVKMLVNTPQVNLDSGINGLLKMADSNRITPEIIHDYTKIILKNRFEILYSPVLADDRQPEIMDKFKNIIANAARYYDYVIVDLKKGLKNSNQLEILKMSDVVVANVDQNMSTIENFFQMNETKELYSKMIWNICKYDRKSKYNIKNLTRTVLKKQAVYGIDYNTLVLDVSQEGNLAEFAFRLKTLKDEDANQQLLKQIQELIEGIMLKNKETQMRK